MKEPRRIALVITTLEVGGAEKCLTELACRLDRDRYEPGVFCLAPRPRDDRAALVERLEDAGVPVTFLDAGSRWELRRVRRRLRSELRQFQPHVTHAFLYHAIITVCSITKGGTAGPIVAGLRVAEQGRLRHWLLRRTRQRVDCFVCASQGVARHARKVIRLPEPKLHVIPNGVEVSKEDQADVADLPRLGIPSGRRVLTFVGRLETQKGVDRLVAMAPRLLGELPEHDLLIVGDGPLLDDLVRAAARHGCTGRVHFCGWRSDAPAIMRASELILLPSRYEGMSNVLLEAMACGRAVAATDVEGVAEALGDRAAEQTALPGDEAVFLNRVIELARDEGLRGQLGAANFRRVSSEFSYAAMVGRYQRLCDELIL